MCRNANPAPTALPATSASSQGFTQSGPDKSAAIWVALFQRITPVGWRPFVEPALRPFALFTVEKPQICFSCFTCLLNLSQPVQKYRIARDAAAALNKTKAATGLGTDTAARDTLGSELSKAAETHHCALLCCHGWGARELN